MLDFYCRLATKLIPLRIAFVFLLMVDLGVIGYSLLFPRSAAFNLGLLPSLLILLWLLLLLLFCQMFCNIHELNTQPTGLFKRARHKLKRFVYASFALFFSCLSCAFILLTLRSLNIWLQT